MFEVLQLQLGFDDHPLGRYLKGFGEDEDGELYALVSLELAPVGSTGEVLRLVPAGGLTFADVTVAAGVGLTGELNESVAWGDYDNDGDQDLYLTVDGANRLYRNDGSGAFTDVTTAAGVGHSGFGVGAAFGDFDNDGNLDLYVVNFGSGSDVLYRNDGPVGPDSQYVVTDVTVSSGTTIERSSRGVALLDYDRDGLLDIYTGNRSGAISSLYMNEGGVFTDMAASAGLSAAGLGMGVLSFDFDNDLDFDLYWTTWPGGGPVPNALYENLGQTSFANVTVASGTADTNGWGISCNAGDIDNDGFQDFFVTNGADPGSTPSVLFQNQGDGTFLDATSAIGGAAFDGRGVAFSDFDNDGDLDLVVTTDAEEETHLWRNDSNNDNHWITLKLVGTVSNRSAIGARVELTTPLMTTVQEVSGGAGRGSFNSLPLEFGLAEADTIDEVRIRWPSGRNQTIQGIAVDQILTVQEPPPGDFNEDGFVDLVDYAAFEACMSGPGVSYDARRGEHPKRVGRARLRLHTCQCHD